MRWVMVGAGAVGGLIGGRLIERTGAEVVLVARGPHADAIAADGLLVRGPDHEVTVRPHALWRPHTIGDLDGALVVLAVKSHQTAGALAALGPGLDRAAAVVCAQNGVTNEPAAAAATAAPIIGAMVWTPAVHLVPGQVESHGRPDAFLVLGDWPGSSSGAVVAGACAELTDAGLACEATGDIAAWKRGKLLTNLGNALDAFCGPGGRRAIYQRLRDEGIAAFEAAGLAYLDPEELTRRATAIVDNRAGDRERPGGSTWQSLARGGPGIEVAHFNGYIADLADAHGAAAPWNRGLADLAPAFARGERAPRSLSPDQLRALLDGGAL